MYGSETTGQNFSWRAAAALLQARARRFSGSTNVDREPGSLLSMQASQDLGGLQPVARISIDSNALEFADLSIDSFALQRKSVITLPRDSHEYIPAVHSSPASDSSALHTVSQTSSGSHQVIPFCHHCGTVLHPKPPPHAVVVQQPAEIPGERRTLSGSFKRGLIRQRSPRRVSSSFAGPVQSRAASTGSIASQQALTQHGEVTPFVACRTCQVSVTAAASADAASKQLSAFCGLQNMTGLWQLYHSLMPSFSFVTVDMGPSRC